MFKWTEDLMREYLKCSDSIEYFAEKYIKIMDIDKGLIPIVLTDIQKDIVETYKTDARFYKDLPRQSGKTTISLIILLHQSIFKENITSAAVSDKQTSAHELCNRIREMIENLPEFLKPVYEVNNKNEIRFDNGCRLLFTSNSSGALRGTAIKNLYVDEIDYMSNIEDFIANFLPTVCSSPTSTFFALSTSRIQELFSRIGRKRA